MTVAAHGLDIRVPIGGLFTILGLLIGGYGLATQGDAARYAISGSLNINLWWGLVMLVFGLLLLVAGARSRGRPSGMHPTEESKEGRAIEAREHRTGLERER